MKFQQPFRGSEEMYHSVISMIEADNPQKVADIVQATIQEIYPHYYSAGAVKFFRDLHSVEKIRLAMDAEKIYLFVSGDIILGTGSIRGNEICRLFVLPQYQGKGYGSGFMDLLEERIFSRFSTVSVDASFPAESMYLKRGYQIVSYEKIKTGNGDFLCYHKMEKQCILGDDA